MYQLHAKLWVIVQTVTTDSKNYMKIEKKRSLLEMIRSQSSTKHKQASKAKREIDIEHPGYLGSTRYIYYVSNLKS